MLGCRKMRGLIAASVHGELSEAERPVLERHLTVCPACRAEASALAALAAKIPRSTEELGIDLVPRLRARLAEEHNPRGVPAWRWGVACASGMLAVVLFYAVAVQVWPLLPGSHVLSVASATNPSLDKTLEQADRLLAERNYTGAYDLLAKGLAEHTSDSAAAAAQLKLADLAFEQHWYDRADQDYQTLMTRYPDAVQSVKPVDKARVLERWNMLDEGRKTRYELLHALDRARLNPGGAFEKYEQVVAQAPTSYAAQSAMREMVALVNGALPEGDPRDVVTAMRTVRERCKHPIAVAKLDLEIGLTAWHDLGDLNLAREALRQVATGDEPVLAQRARQALSEIQAQNPT